MDSTSNGAHPRKSGSVIPKPRDHVSTMVGKKIVETVSKVLNSTVGAAKHRTNKEKICPETSYPPLS